MWHVGLVSVVLLNWLCDLGRSTWPQEVAISSPSKEAMLTPSRGSLISRLSLVVVAAVFRTQTRVASQWPF